MKKVICMGIFTLFLSVSLLFASGGQQGQNNTTTTIRFSWWGSDPRHQATLDAINKYTAANPNIKIEAEYGGFDGYRDKMTTQMAGGTEPDLMQIDQPWLADFSVMGDFFEDLNNYTNIIDLSGFDKKFMNDFCVVNNKLVGLPTGLNGLNFIVNTKLAAQCGIDLSGQWDWERYYEEGKKVNQNNPNNYFLNMDLGGTAYFVGRIYLYQLSGKPLVNDDYTIAVTKDELRQTYNYLWKLYRDKVALPAEEAVIFTGSPQDNPKWNNDQLCSWFNWASTTGFISFADHAVALPYPILKDAKQSSYIVRPAQIFSISKNSKSKDETAKFVNYMFNNDEGILALGTQRSIPPVEKARELLAANNMLDPLAAKSMELVMANVGNRETDLSTNDEIGTIMNEAVEKIAYGQSTVDNLVDDTFRLWQDTLDNLKASRN